MQQPQSAATVREGESKRERAAEEMTSPHRKRKAAASPDPAGSSAPPLDPEARAALMTKLSGLIVHTRERKHLKVAHTHRNGRTVFVPNTDKPVPTLTEKGEERVYSLRRQTAECAKVALKCYNRLNEDDEHELVKAVDCVTFFFNGEWMHANFLAKSKGATTCPDLVPKYFFAELNIGPGAENKVTCVSCVNMDPANPKTAPVHGCKICLDRIFHPAAGGHRGASSGLDRRGSVGWLPRSPPAFPLSPSTQQSQSTRKGEGRGLLKR